MTPRALKDVTKPLSNAGVTATHASLRQALQASVSPEARIHMCHPFGDISGPDAWFTHCFAPLMEAMPDLERRELIVLAGTTSASGNWVGICGNYLGTFTRPFLGLLPTGRIAHMRFHEFYRIEDDTVVEIQAIWDLPELMMTAGQWPMAPQLGDRFLTPSPMTQDGLLAVDAFPGQGKAAQAHVIAMLTDMCRHPSQGGPEIMNLERYWHPRFNWYGPAGIGTSRGIQGFRDWHQIPFLRAMPDRALDPEGLASHWVAEGDYVCETGWPNMRQTLSVGGWLGLPPTGQKIELRSLDFWHLQDGLIRENWVLVDLMHVYHQLGVDVLERAGEFNKARVI